MSYLQRQLSRPGSIVRQAMTNPATPSLSLPAPDCSAQAGNSAAFNATQRQIKAWIREWVLTPKHNHWRAAS